MQCLVLVRKHATASDSLAVDGITHSLRGSGWGVVRNLHTHTQSETTQKAPITQTQRPRITPKRIRGYLLHLTERRLQHLLLCRNHLIERIPNKHQPGLRIQHPKQLRPKYLLPTNTLHTLPILNNEPLRVQPNIQRLNKRFRIILIFPNNLHTHPQSPCLINLRNTATEPTYTFLGLSIHNNCMNSLQSPRPN